MAITICGSDFTKDLSKKQLHYPIFNRQQFINH